MHNPKHVIDIFTNVQKGVLSLKTVMFTLGIKKSRAYEMYQRFLKGENIYKDRGHRPVKLETMHEFIIRDTYSSLEYRKGDTSYYPSMPVLKSIVEEDYLDFPALSFETYRKIVKVLDIYPKCQKKAKRYRVRFQADAVGQLVQGDVTEHEWIEGAEPFKLLMFIDDRSRYVLYARFIEHDNLEAHIEALKDVLTAYGKPHAIYYDNDAKYRKKIMGRPVDAVIVKGLNELDVTVINSTPYMPQGKGKIERKFLTFQMQLIFWMKHRKVKSWEEAQNLLQWYVEKHNQTRSRALNKKTPEEVFKNDYDVFRDLKEAELETLENTLTERDVRRVDEVNEISFNGKQYRLPAFCEAPLSGKTVELRINPGRWFRLFYRGLFIAQYKINNKYGGKDEFKSD